MKIFVSSFFLIVCFALGSCSPKMEVKPQEIVYAPATPLPPPLPVVPKNVIFLIGDGMGLTQISTAIITSKAPMHLERFKHIGFHKNSSADDLVTDSAAGATAFSIGKKTNNRFIGVCPDTINHETVLEESQRRGMATGLVATSTIVHATPASFIANCPNRKDYELIADQMASSGVDIMIGGGSKFFTRRETDDRNLFDEMKAQGYQCNTFFDAELAEMNFAVNKKYIFLTADESPIPVSQGRDYLIPATKKSVRYLNKKDPEGFFAVIEGSQIDWGGHANNLDYVLSELHEFDQAVGWALDFARKNGETLVLVTADHETGGLTILKGSTKEDLKHNFSSDYHTAQMIPVFAYGPGSEHFQGIYENTDIYHKLRKAMGWE